MKSIKSYFDLAIGKGASDLHLVSGERPTLRVDGNLVDIEDKDLPEKELETGLLSLLSAEQKKKYQEELELDFGYQDKDMRFRVNLHQQQEKIGMAARLIPHDIPSPEDLRFESILNDFTNLLNGLVLVVGPTGHGKSTTLASMIEEINKTRKAHIITIEDPIEFLFEDKESMIEQREVGTDTKSFAAALKHVLRQDPNVILVGEMRDPETIATVLTAAETGHLVFSTLHTSSAAEAIERIVDVFDGAKQKQILIQLSAVLRGVVSQQLIPTKDGKRVAAREILVNTPAISNLIRENNIAQIPSSIQTGMKDGMSTLENSLKQLVKEDLIDEGMVEKRTGRQKRI
ncbi:MAG: PilT/PilU family type 4a pilus ATPase [Candidatus Magasanikbacteria bacterium]|jgi:twitching motility protein PilT|nr:PilT/PilU family type 4a pilus ATPase [Candidatus Magasanikbacteria bacterium]MBT4314789.1 PilT/PilU family type 4a pilus ATPase [Candidatus Magasanikbacteria bacterium]MBT4547566.1 PilT/PilU family type 4a pilus ATPase [Candidatus Magasanikbacteria bacterium]MBT6818815.1 PilT/PilU family type 4a pilus ATPase [Candidatus Magasanikbacteria bacterium]